MNIGNNQFEDVPECLFHLANLETLLCYNNRLKSIHLGLFCKYKYFQHRFRSFFNYRRSKSLLSKHKGVEFK